MRERWKSVVGYEGLYDVSDQGRVRRACATHKSPKGRILTPASDGGGYRNLVLYDHGARRTALVHRLVARAFLGPCPEGHQVNHRNGVRDDNRLLNLEYVTRSRNKQHGFEIGISQRPKGTLNGMARLEEEDVREIRKLWAQRPGKRLAPDHPLSRDSIAKRFGVTGSNISLIVRGKLWTHLSDET